VQQALHSFAKNFMNTGSLYKQLTPEDIASFASFVGADAVFQDAETLLAHAKDHTEDLTFLPHVVLVPATAQQISEILKHCNQHKISVTVRGAGTGLSGGALPIFGGVVISMKRFNKILEIDKDNFQCTVESGVVNEDIQNAVKEVGLFYPPDPASKGSCFIGGNVAHSSGGPRALKYGTTRDYILNLEVVLPSGEVIWTGANTLKYSTGYNLTHIIIGSEGTLTVVTKVVLRLITFPTKNAMMLASFSSAVQACKTVNELFLQGCSPSVCEFVEPEGFKLSSAFTSIPFAIAETTKAYLLLEVDGHTDESVMQQCEAVYTVLDKCDAQDVMLADSSDNKETLWKLRRTIGESTKHNNIYKEEDTVVPRAALPQLFAGVKEICKRYNLRSICYGHAGDGNLHVNILKDMHTEEYWQNETKMAIREIFQLCVMLKGTISGEHGIGIVQKEYMPIALQETHFELMRGIKKAFDPNHILNPGKIF
jgi:glycolate oxidase